MNLRALPAFFAATLVFGPGCGSDRSSTERGSGTGGILASAGGVANQGATPGGLGGSFAGSGGMGSPSGSGGAVVPAGGAAGSSGGSSAGASGSVGTGGAIAAGGAGGASSAGVAGGMNAAGAPGQDAGAIAGACDRACLVAVLSTYLDALAARTPAKVPVAASVKYTDDGVTANLGDGLWKTASALVATERLDFADPLTGQVASQLVVNENGATPVIYQVRLKVVDHAITEIESMTVRQVGAANGFFSPQNMKPQPAFLEPIEPAKRMTRAQMKAEVDLYIQYLDGKTKASGVHFDPQCDRFENGVETATGLASFQAQSWMFDVTPRYLIFDEEMGIVWGMFPFSAAASSLVVGEAFKVMDVKIMMIQAVMATIPTTAWN